MLPFFGALAAWQAILSAIPSPVFLFIIVVFAFLFVIGVLRILLEQ